MYFSAVVIHKDYACSLVFGASTEQEMFLQTLPKKKLKQKQNMLF